MHELYPEQVEWLRGCIRIRLRRYRLTRWEREDIAGACWVRLVKGYARFDPSKGKTAQAWRNYGITVINNTVTNEVKKMINYKRLFSNEKPEMDKGDKE